VIEFLRLGPVIPVIAIDNADHAVRLARALVAGGVRVLEVTLRTPAGLDAIRAIARHVPEAIVGAGTLRHPDEFAAAHEAGARFGVSPGLTPALVDAARASGLPWLPGVMTPSEVMDAQATGFSHLKLFPAQQAGGTGMLKALYGPFPDVVFCPTGGISPDNAAQFLSLPNVACVGGSWLTPPAAVKAEDWSTIEALARQAAALSRSGTRLSTLGVRRVPGR
jgi:2-dehydro-3-deoxyphosphogluconate aldolase / (4S)-4-hydroxy-2-oxoglutarate aldolase